MSCVNNNYKSIGNYHSLLLGVQDSDFSTRIRMSIAYGHARACFLFHFSKVIFIRSCGANPRQITDTENGQGSVGMGKDVFLSSHGSVYEGESVNDERHGQGTYHWSSGDSYEGEWRGGLRHGQGTYLSSNGDSYEGEWRDGLRHGQGTYRSSSGGSYTGGWQGGMQHGQGRSCSSDGDSYEGEWQSGMQHGQGMSCSSNGDSYEGEWREGLRHGQGTMRKWNGTPILRTWCNDYPSNAPTLKHLYCIGANLPSFKDLPHSTDANQNLQYLILQSTDDHNGALGLEDKKYTQLGSALERAGCHKLDNVKDSTILFKESLELQINNSFQKMIDQVDILWVNAHGSRDSIVGVSNPQVLSDIIAPILSGKSFVILASCSTGKCGGFAEQLQKDLIKKRLNKEITIFAPDDRISEIAIDLEPLVSKREVSVYMTDLLAHSGRNSDHVQKYKVSNTP